MGEERDPGEGDEPEPDEGHGPLAVVLEDVARDRFGLAFVRDHERRCAVDENAGAAEEREDDESDAGRRPG